MLSIQFVLHENGVAGIKALGDCCGIIKPQDVLYESVNFFGRVVAEVKLGHKIMSIPTENGRIVASVNEHNQIMTVLCSDEILRTLATKYR